MKATSPVKLPSIQDLDLNNRAVFMRLDLNVPLKDGKITSDARIQAALPTIRYALEKGAKLAIASHLGRPKGKFKKEDSLEPVGAHLSELLKQEVLLSEDCIGDGVKGLMRDLRPGGILLLENLRFHNEEEANDVAFARQLAAPFEVYINDAFGASHRAHASIVGMVKNIATCGAGFLLEKEVNALQTLLHEPKKPFVAIVGGAKVSDKVGVLEALLGRVTTLCIGGAMAYTFLKAQDHDCGKSKIEDDKLHVASDVIKRAKARGVELMLPTDHVCASDFAESAAPTVVTTPAIPAHLMGLDIGPDTRAAYVARVHSAATVFWNGPMGVFEWDRFAAGTRAVAAAVAKNPGYTVVGGGDSVAAIEQAGVADKIKHVSTGGGASLELLQYGTLPGIEALHGKF